MNDPTRVKILKTAFRLIKEQGYDQTKVSDICKASEISRSSFYYHFPTKDAILNEFNLYSENYVMENLTKFAASDNYVEQLWHLYSMYIDPIQEAGIELNKLSIFKNMNQDSYYYAPGESKLWDAEVALIEKAQKSGQINNMGLPSDILKSLIYAMDGVTVVWCIKKEDFNFKEEIKCVFINILQIEASYMLDIDL